MPFLSKFESKLGLTRGDVTVALVLAGTSLVGFVYTTFFDQRSGASAHRELLVLQNRHDSVVAAHKAARLAQVERILQADSVPAWKPPGAGEEAADDAVRTAEKSGSAGGAKELPSGPVDLNRAPKLELMKLPGVGEKTAAMIVERRTHVPFRRIDEIMEVKGIGEKKFAKMKPYITVR